MLIHNVYGTGKTVIFKAGIMVCTMMCLGLFAATTTELIKNGDFGSTVTSNWTLVSTDTSVKGAIVNQEYVITRSKHASASDTLNSGIAFVQKGITLEKDKYYTVRFTAKADSAFTAKVVAKMTKSPWGGYSQYQECSIKTTIDTFNFVFRMDSTTDTNSCLEFDLGWMRAVGKISLDNISLKVQPGNTTNSSELLINGDFSSPAVSSWLLNLQGKNTGARVIKDGQLEVTITKWDTACSEKPYLIQVQQTGLKLLKDASYKLAFAIKADSNIVSGNYYVGMNKDPWDSYCAYPMLSAGPTWDSSQYVEFTMSNADNGARVVFDLGGLGGPGKVYFDNISLKCTSCNSGVAELATVHSKSPKLFAILKNRSLEIAGVSSPVSIRLYNSSGKAVLSLGEIKPNNGTVSLSLCQKTAAGVYFARIIERNAPKNTSSVVRLIHQ
jgi:hypothetical protein